MPQGHYAVPNHFRSLRTPSPRARDKHRQVGFAAQPQSQQDTGKSNNSNLVKLNGWITSNNQQQSRHDRRSGFEDTPVTIPTVLRKALGAKPLLPQKYPPQKIKTNRAPVAVVSTIQSPNQQSHNHNTTRTSSITSSSTGKHKQQSNGRPQLRVNTALPDDRSPDKKSSRPRSPNSPTHGPFNNGSQRPDVPDANKYRIKLAQDHTALYAWLLDRQENFWASRGL